MTPLAQSLIADIPRLTADEQAAVRFVVDRILVQGRAGYQPWQAAGDGRDMDREIADELADAIVYVGMRAVMRSLFPSTARPAPLQAGVAVDAAGSAGLAGRLDIRATDHYCLHTYVDGVCAGCGGGLP